MIKSHTFALVLTVALVGCSFPVEDLQGGMLTESDSGPMVDATPGEDLGVPDVDGGPPLTDLGTSPEDLGMVADLGTPDLGVDAGMPDMGPTLDRLLRRPPESGALCNDPGSPRVSCPSMQTCRPFSPTEMRCEVYGAGGQGASCTATSECGSGRTCYNGTCRMVCVYPSGGPCDPPGPITGCQDIHQDGHGVCPVAY